VKNNEWTVKAHWTSRRIRQNSAFRTPGQIRHFSLIPTAKKHESGEIGRESGGNQARINETVADSKDAQKPSERMSKTLGFLAIFSIFSPKRGGDQREVSQILANSATNQPGVPHLQTPQITCDDAPERFALGLQYQLATEYSSRETRGGVSLCARRIRRQ